MKKFLILLIGLFLVQNCSIARDYTKIQMKELKHAQKYGTTQIRTQDFSIAKPTVNKNLKDPHILKCGDYEIDNNTEYKAKLKEDEQQYKVFEKNLKKVKLSNYNAQAYGNDYYKVYRVAEKIIRANRLDYQTWRIGVTRASDIVNAYSISGNYINLNTSTIDTFIDNDNALAFIIGHEIAHLLLGHQKRTAPTLKRMERQRKLSDKGSVASTIFYVTLKSKYRIDSKNMEFAADIEGAKLAAKAGYDMTLAKDALVFFNSIDSESDFRSTHPSNPKRIENYNQNTKYIPTEEYKEWGKYNIMNTPVLNVTASSDRKSIVISASGDKTNPSQYYHTETPQELLLRFAYTSYLNMEFDKSLEYFEKYFNMNNNNAIAYLYASYAADEQYKKTQQDKYKNIAVEYITKAKELDPKNKYIKEQAKALK